jgi:hypothetical protein
VDLTNDGEEGGNPVRRKLTFLGAGPGTKDARAVVAGGVRTVVDRSSQVAQLEVLDATRGSGESVSPLKRRTAPQPSQRSASNLDFIVV